MKRVGLTVILLLFGALGFLGLHFLSVLKLRDFYPQVKYLGPKKTPVMEFYESKPANWVDIRRVSRSAVAAVVVSEDWLFFEHKGFDFDQLEKALKQNLEKGKVVRGGSTITQQVAKNVFLNRNKNLWRKARESLFAILLERNFTKNEILEIYLNVAEWGEGVFGIKAASQVYFGKLPSLLTPKEGAFLAMLLPSPKRYGVSFRKRHLTHYAEETVEDILEKMKMAGYLSESDYLRELATPLEFRD